MDQKLLDDIDACVHENHAFLQRHMDGAGTLRSGLTKADAEELISRYRNTVQIIVLIRQFDRNSLNVAVAESSLRASAASFEKLIAGLIAAGGKDSRK